MHLENNYHTHTARCGHAIGTDEEYVLNAIKAGIKELGFSDHAPFKGGSQPGIRMELYRLDEYIASINVLKKKYQDQIKIYCGLEAEYYHEIKPYYAELLSKLDYLICGQHFAIDMSTKTIIYNGYKRDDQGIVIDYVDRVVEAIESGFFKYIAHPDLILNSYTLRDEFIEGQMRRICEAAEKHHIPLEYNLEGVKKQIRLGILGEEQFYPYDYFWKLVQDYDIDVIIGADVHDPEDLVKDHDKYGYQVIEKYHLHLIQKIDI